MNAHATNTTSGQTSNNSATAPVGAAGGFKRSHKSQPQGVGNAPAAGLQQVVFPPNSQRPTFCCYDQTFLVANQQYREGVYYHYLEQEEDALGNKIDVPIDRWICSVLKVLCIVRTDSSNEHSYLIEYVAHGETHPRRAVLSQALLLGRPEEPLKALRDLGVSVLFQNLKVVRSYLDNQHLRFSYQTPADFWNSVKVVGWAPAPTCFVLPNEIIGRQNGVWFSGKGDVAQYEKRGHFDQWQTEVAGLCEGNSYLILSLSSAFAGPLLELLNIPGLGIHFHGDSTTGKTSALAVASSVWSSPKFMISWRATANGLEIQAASRSSTLVPVDESHQIEPKVLDAGVYMLLNGTAKARMNRDTSAKEVARWRVSVLSSGERSIESHLGAANIDYKAGQGVRIVDVPVSGRFGIFDDVHGAANGSLFADTLRNAAAKHYGHAGPLFVQQLIDKFSGLSLPAQLVDILKPFGDDLNAQEARVARSFAVIALAGELAIEWGVLPWQQKAAHIAAMGIFNHWIATQPRSKQSREYAEILKRVRDFIETYGACFSDIDWTPNYDSKGRLINPEPVIHERAGYWEESGNKRICLFTAKGLEKASGSFGTRRAAEVLDQVGALTAKGSGGKRAKKRRVPDGRPMELYHIDPEKLTEGTI